MIFMALHWTLSTSSLSLLCWGAQDSTQRSRCLLTRAEQRGRTTSLDLLGTLFPRHPKCTALALLASRAYSHYSPRFPLFSCFGMLCICRRLYLQATNHASDAFSVTSRPAGADSRPGRVGPGRAGRGRDRGAAGIGCRPGGGRRGLAAARPLFGCSRCLRAAEVWAPRSALERRLVWGSCLAGRPAPPWTWRIKWRR